MTVTITIDSVNKTSLAQRGSLNIQHAVNQRSTASFRLVDTAGTYRPDVGDPVTITDGATTIFGGSVDEARERKILGSSALDETIPLVDYHQLADRRVIAETYESQTVATIVNDIITNYLTAEGISAGNVQGAQTVTKAVFNYVPASQALDELSKLTGYQWRINADKTLDFFARSTFTGTAITESSAIMDVAVKRHRKLYRNRQYIRGGLGITDVQTDEKPTPKPDGVTKTFVTRFPVAKVPTVKVGGSTSGQTVGIRQIETGKEWYWQKNDNTITQSTGGTVLGSTQVLEVTYQGYFPILAQSDDEPEQAIRAAAEGAGTGIYEWVENRPDIDETQQASDVADGLLRRYASITTEVEFSIDGSIYEPGQIITITLPTHDVSGDYLVSEVTITDRGRRDENLSYRVRALSGEAVGGWVRFFRELIQNQQTFAIRENEVLIKNIKLYDTTVLGEGKTVNVVGLTETYDTDLMTINVRGLTQTESTAYTTYNAAGVTQTPSTALSTINLYGWTDPDEYNYSVPIWGVEGGGSTTGAIDVQLIDPVTTVGSGLVGYSEVG